MALSVSSSLLPTPPFDLLQVDVNNVGVSGHSLGGYIVELVPFHPNYDPTVKYPFLSYSLSSFLIQSGR